MQKDIDVRNAKLENSLFTSMCNGNVLTEDICVLRNVDEWRCISRLLRI